MNKVLYKFPIYPLQRVINILPDDILFDSKGFIYIVDDKIEGINFKLKPITIRSVMSDGFTVEGMSKVQFEKLFVPIAYNHIKQY